MRLIIHVGFSKCASTSLQKAMAENSNVFFPQSGRNDYEHLAVPLKIKGIDDWTRQWFDEKWVEIEFFKLLQEIRNSNRISVISSERLASLTNDEMETFVSFFSDYDIEFLCLTRSKDEYVKSTWRHVVSRYDYSVDFLTFQKSYTDYDMRCFEHKFGDSYQVRTIDIEQVGWQESLCQYLGFPVELPYENVGVPFECCEYLQSMHNLVGSTKFKAFFTPRVKDEFAEMFRGGAERSMDEFTVPI